MKKHLPELSGKVVNAWEKFGLGLDLLIDDAPHHHEQKDCITILVERPWNKPIKEKINFEACFSNWQEGEEIILQEIEKIRNLKKEEKGNTLKGKEQEINF